MPRFKKVHLLLSTQGGDVASGINLYNTLSSVPFELTINNVGVVNSAGICIFLAGKRKFASPHSTFMFHNVHFKVQKEEKIDLRRGV